MNRKTLRIIVQKGIHSVEVARYINDNIVEINRSGIFIKLEKIKKLDDELIDALRKRGITRLPAMPMQTGAPLVGKEKIIEYLETRMAGAVAPQRKGYITTDFGSDPALSDYYMRELYDGAKDGKLAPRDDDEENDDGSEDLSRKMRAYQMNTPKHRSTKGARAPPKDKTSNSKSRQDNIAQDDEPQSKTANRRGQIEDDYENEMNPDYSERNVDTKMNYKGGAEDVLDQRMLDAWMQNNPSNYG